MSFLFFELFFFPLIICCGCKYVLSRKFMLYKGFMTGDILFGDSVPYQFVLSH